MKLPGNPNIRPVEGVVMQRPYVIMGGYMSVDGKIAPADRNGLKFTPYLSKALRERLHQLRASVDAVLIGINTVMAYPSRETPRLTVRLVQGRNPMRVVLDSHARIPLDAAILDVREAPTLIAVSEAASPERVRALEERGVEVVRCGERRVDIRRLLGLLYERGVRRLLVEGGGEVRWSFLKERLVDELFVWIMPAIWGGASAPTLVEGEGFLTGDEAVHLELVRTEVVDRHVVLEYRVLR
jgi:2,5-diamino-6-(ribosylamino)-4(3H)-pyrimidinone 5'-phosphate reductase